MFKEGTQISREIVETILLTCYVAYSLRNEMTYCTIIFYCKYREYLLCVLS